MPARCAATIAATVSVTHCPDQERMWGAAGSVFRMRNEKDELSSPLLTALREAEIYANRSKRCAIVCTGLHDRFMKIDTYYQALEWISRWRLQRVGRVALLIL